MTIGITHTDYFSVPWKFCTSLANTVVGVNVELLFVVASNSDIGRNLLLSKARESGVKELFMIDADMTFDKRIFSLRDVEGDVVSALCFEGKPPYLPAVYEWKEGFKHTDKRGIVDGVGFGCVLLKERAIYESGDDPFTCFDEGFGRMSTDLSFCRRVKHLKVVVSDLEVGHLRLGEINSRTRQFGIR